MSALLFSSVFLGLAALGVDTARWYVESEQLQKAADAASLAGVVYMPGDLARARVAALATAERNGFANSGTTTVTVAEGPQPSQLVVTISSRVSNAFAASFGSPTTTLSRAATADYTAPAPMGSPCNTFGNEPPSTTGTAMVNNSTGSAQPSPAFPNCSTNPQFWAAVEGPATDKVQGDRYGTIPCSGSSTYGCAGGRNSEYRSDGYFFAVHVEPAAVGRQLDVQIYDPAFVQTGKDCASIPTRYKNDPYVYDRMSQFTPTDGLARYKNSSSVYCSGDYLGTSQSTAPTTTFVLREQTDTGDPMNGAVVSGCTQQFRGTYATPDDELRQWTSEKGSTSYGNFNPELARVFHQWVSLCTFVPARSGDYFLQVRTNRTFGGAEDRKSVV